MHYFLYLKLDGFYASCDPEPERPLIVHRDKRVLDVNDGARERGIVAGMRLSEAKSIAHGGSFIAWEEERYRDVQRRWLDVCCEYSDTIEPDDQHTASVDLSTHPTPEPLAFALVSRIERLGWRARAGMGPSKWIAQLASSREIENHSLLGQLALREPCFDPAGFLATLSISSLAPVLEEHRRRLLDLGYRTIGQVAALPLEILKKQFGEAATHIAACSRGGFFEAVDSIYPSRSMAERVNFEGVIDNTDQIDHAFQRLSATLSERLSANDLWGKHIVLTFEHDAPEPTLRRRCFSKPIQSYATVLSCLRLLLNPMPDRPIAAIRVRMEELAPAGRIQRELSGRTTRGERVIGAAEAFRHVRTVFGDRSIQSGDEIEDPRRKQVLRAWKDATGWA